MTQIVLTEEQAKLLSPVEAVQICDPRGQVVAVIQPAITAEELSTIRRPKDCQGPWLPAEQVHQSLAVLEEAWQGEGPFDIERARAIVRDFRAGRGY